MTQALRFVHQRVEPDATQILDRTFAGRGPRFRPHVVAMIRAAAVARKITATMSGHDLQPRVSIQHATKNEMGQRKGRLQRLPDDVAEIVRAQAFSKRCAEGMNENDGAELFGRGPEWREVMRPELQLVDRRRYLDALEPQPLDGIRQLFGGELRMLKRKSSKADQ